MIAVSSSSLPSLSLLMKSPSTFFFRLLLQPYAQHCVPFFPIVIRTPTTIYVLRTQRWSHSGHKKMAPFITRGIQFRQYGNNRLLDPVFFLDQCLLSSSDSLLLNVSIFKEDACFRRPAIIPLVLIKSSAHALIKKLNAKIQNQLIIALVQQWIGSSPETKMNHT